MAHDTLHDTLLVAITPQLYHDLFDPDADNALRDLVEVTFPTTERNLTEAELAQLLPGHALVLTGWGTPTFSAAVRAAATDLKLVAHSAGSIKKLLPPPVFEQGIAVTHAAAAIAPAVAEMTVLLILLSLRQAHQLDRQMKAGTPWAEAKSAGMGQEVAGQRVGVVGAGYTGRELCWRLNGLRAEVLVYDPYLTPQRAAELGVTKVERLNDLFRDCPIITMQAPPTAETARMVGAEQLALLRDGGIFINTARSLTVDQEALLAEFQSGRIHGALDVFDEEPLPVDSPFRRLENVIITPHIAGASQQARRRQGRYIVDEIRRFLQEKPLHFAVTRDMLETMA